MAQLGSRISAIIRSHVRQGDFTGGSALLARNGSVIYVDSLGTAESDPSHSIMPDSIFGVMSMTKPITATAAATLVSEGLLDPRAPLSEYIPEFRRPARVRVLRPGHRYRTFRMPPDPELDALEPEPEFDYVPSHRPITVQDILSFTSGLQTIGIPNSYLPPVHEDDRLASWVPKLAEVPLEFQPGSQWHYSNATGYEVLARLVEVASGRDFSAFTRERLFEPLGMKDTQFGVNSANAGRLVPLGPFAGDRITRADFPSGSAGLFTTLTDYWAFAQMLLERGMFRGKRIIGEEAVKLMTRNQIENLPFPGVRSRQYASLEQSAGPGFRYGYGVAIVTGSNESDTSLPDGSFGWDGIGTRRFWVMPALNAVLIMLMTGVGASADACHEAIERSVSSELA